MYFFVNLCKDIIDCNVIVFLVVILVIIFLVFILYNVLDI